VNGVPNARETLGFQAAREAVGAQPEDYAKPTLSRMRITAQCPIALTTAA
jgi:hypothetical protein